MADNPNLPPIQFTADGPSDEVREANLETVMASPGYGDMAILIADGLTKMAGTVVLDYARDAVSVRYQIDSVWHQMPQMDRESADHLLASMKRLAHLNYQERRARQDGQFVALFHAFKSKCSIISQGTKTGERVVIRLKLPRTEPKNWDDLGMRKKMQEQLREFIAVNEGLVLFSSLPGDGMSTSWHAALDSCDRFMRDFFSVEDVHAIEKEVINVESVTYDSKSGETPMSVIPQILLREPNVLCVPNLTNGENIEYLCDLANEDEKLIVSTIHAKSAVEALLRALVHKPPADKFAKAIRCVINQRMVRKLCDNCKQAYQPAPQLLQKLGIPVGRVREFYNEFQPPPPEMQVDDRGNPIEIKPCPKCSGIGFYGLTSIYELMVVTDEMRRVLQTQPNVKALTEAAKNAGHISLRDEGIVLVARGVTSINELQRVLKK